MSPNGDNLNNSSLYNLSSESKAVINIVRPLLDAYKDTNITLKILIDEADETEKRDEKHYTGLKDMLQRHQLELKELLINMDSKSQEILVGSTLGEVGGIKKDITGVINILKSRTPWWRTITVVVSIITALSVLIGIFIKIMLM